MEHSVGSSELVCSTCGRLLDADEEIARARLTWTRGLENGRPVWTCDRCSRDHLRSIEGKLDSSWW
jgi:DNA-directed RNA polymerase subunit RPC12/RpoP